MKRLTKYLTILLCIALGSPVCADQFVVDKSVAQLKLDLAQSRLERREAIAAQKRESAESDIAKARIEVEQRERALAHPPTPKTGGYWYYFFPATPWKLQREHAEAKADLAQKELDAIALKKESDLLIAQSERAVTAATKRVEKEQQRLIDPASVPLTVQEKVKEKVTTMCDNITSYNYAELVPSMKTTGLVLGGVAAVYLLWKSRHQIKHGFNYVRNYEYSKLKDAVVAKYVALKNRLQGKDDKQQAQKKSVQKKKKSAHC